MAQSLFDKYGGLETITSVVHEFYKKVLANGSLKGFFQDVEIDELMSHQTHFLCFALGGPNLYKGRDLKEAHKSMNITFADFTSVAEILEETLDEAGVEDQDVATILKIVGETQNLIVSAGEKNESA